MLSLRWFDTIMGDIVNEQLNINFDEYFSEFVTGYAQCELWSHHQTNEDLTMGENFEGYLWDDLTIEARASMIADCAGFVGETHEALIASGLSAESAGHDFSLTRNGHGTGFWDRGIGDIGEALSKIARVYGDTDYWVNVDNKVDIG